MAESNFDYFNSFKIKFKNFHPILVKNNKHLDDNIKQNIISPQMLKNNKDNLQNSNYPLDYSPLDNISYKKNRITNSQNNKIKVNREQKINHIIKDFNLQKSFFNNIKLVPRVKQNLIKNNFSDNFFKFNHNIIPKAYPQKIRNKSVPQEEIDKFLSFNSSASIKRSNNTILLSPQLKINEKEIRERGFYQESLNKSIKEYSYKEFQNSKYRQEMQDFYKIVEKHLDNPSYTIFSLYDGHGGCDTAKYARDRFPEIFTKLCVEKKKSTQENLISSFIRLDEEIKVLNKYNEGCTATIVYFMEEAHSCKVYLANIGDTRCVLVNNEGAKRISFDHKCSNLEESERLLKSGGTITNGRLFKYLNISRSFGDFSLKNYGVTSYPFINKITLKETDIYIIIASDGVWDVLFDNDIYHLSKYCKNSLELANIIVEKAISLGSTDNISCIVIKLQIR